MPIRGVGQSIDGFDPSLMISLAHSAQGVSVVNSELPCTERVAFSTAFILRVYHPRQLGVGIPKHSVVIRNVVWEAVEAQSNHALSFVDEDGADAAFRVLDQEATSSASRRNRRVQVVERVFRCHGFRRLTD